MFSVLLSVLLVGGGLVEAKSWISLGAKIDAGASFRVITSRGYGTVLNTVIPGIQLDETVTGESISYQLSIPGGSSLKVKSYPELPKLTAFVAIPNEREAEVRIVDAVWEEIELDRAIIPSKGPLLRTVNPDDIPYMFGAVYGSDEFFPPEKDIVSISDPFVLRDVKGVRLTVVPCRYNPVSGKLLVAKKLVVSVETMGRSLSVFRSKNTKVSPEYAAIYKQLFVNNQFTSTRYAPVEEAGKVLIIAADEFAGAVTPLRDWRLKSGFNTELFTISQIARNSEEKISAQEIYAFIQSRYNMGNLGYIILVGDSDKVPTLVGTKEGADSDPCFTKLAGDDHVPDCFISRISAETVADVENQVARFIGYERNPFSGADAAWYEKSTGIASNEGSPSDGDRADWLRELLIDYGYSTVDRIYDPRASKAKLAKAINQGRSSINYIGHGSRTTWVTTRFSNRDVDKLTNTWKLPVIWSVACVNGDFTSRYGDCFAERWMKAGTADAPTGAIGIFAASTNAEWVPPCDMQFETVKLTVEETMSTCGGLATNGVLKAMEIWGTSSGSSGVMLMEQYNFFGDVSLTVRSKKARSIDLDAQLVGRQLSIKVTSDGQSVKGARVTIYNADLSGWQSLSSNSEGIAMYTISRNEAMTKLFTVTGLNLVPQVDVPLESLLAE